MTSHNTAPHANPQRQLMQDARFIAGLRLQMLKFATLQLADVQLAEDAVQEALISAFKHVDSFAGQSAFKTWVFAILKNKIVDQLRKQQQLTPISSLFHDEDTEQASMDQLFNDKGHWHMTERPVAWSLPDRSAENQQFWQVFESCLTHLPAQQAQVFMLREFIELETDKICSKLALSVSNLHVLIYRARLKLRECLENKWMLQEDCAC
ncbi:MAG: RNA polymerase factor sigma-70 [Moraxellaceae bacterium]